MIYIYIFNSIYEKRKWIEIVLLLKYIITYNIIIDNLNRGNFRNKYIY